MKSFVLLLTICFSIFASAQIEVDQTIKDFGVKEEGQKLFKHKFVIRNTGDDTLRIQKVKPGCSCTIVDFPKVIAPGDSGIMASSLEVKKSGSYNKGIKVFSNSKENAILSLRLKVEVLSKVNLSNRYIMLQEGDNNTYETSLVVSTKAENFQIEKLTYKKRGDEEAPIRDVKFTMTELPSMKEDFYQKWLKQFETYNDLKLKTLRSIFSKSESSLEKSLSYYITKLEATEQSEAHDKLKLKALEEQKIKLLNKYFKNSTVKKEELANLTISEQIRNHQKDYALGYKKYRLNFALIVELEYSEPGTFHFYTNVEDKKEIKLPSILEPARK